MFNLNIRTNAAPITKIAKVSDNIGATLATEGISTQGAVVTLNGRPVMDLDVTFADMGVTPGKSAILSIVVKTSSAA